MNTKMVDCSVSSQMIFYTERGNDKCVYTGDGYYRNREKVTLNLSESLTCSPEVFELGIEQ